MSGPWGKSNIGNWAAETEAEEREVAAAAAAAGQADVQSFPSLKEAVTAKPKKKKMSLSEFHTVPGAGGGGTAAAAARLTPEEMMRLPTGPKERSAEEMQYGRLGGGFSAYGRDRGPQNRREESDGSWGGGGGGGGGRRSYGGFDDDRRGSSPRVSDFDQPSRADEVDNWASAKKTLPSFDSGRQNRYSSLGGGGGGRDMGGYGSRADDVDNWAMGKKPVPARSSTFGTSFRDALPEPDRWSRGGMREPMRGEPERERPRLVLDARKGDAGVTEPGKVNKSNPFGAARPREEVLAEKGLDWKKLESELEAKKTSRPSSAHSSRPSSAQSNRSESQSLPGVENVIKPRPKVNPFGDAKPREVLLEEKGLDWRKIDLDLEHRAIERPETEEEKLLKDELDDLKKQLETDPNLQEIVLQKEKELELLVRDLDDKVRFGQKAVDRPGSGAGRAGGFVDRPPSQSGSHEESRNIEYVDRPRSGGTGDGWARPGEDRRGFQGGRERGFLGNRDMDRPRSRDRW